METIDRNWYSSESVRHEREEAEAVLGEMKRLEEEYGVTRRKVVERLPFGLRVRYERVETEEEG